MKSRQALILAIVIPLIVFAAFCTIYVTRRNRRRAEAYSRRYDEAVAVAGTGQYARAMQILEELMMPSCGADLSAKARAMYSELQRLQDEEKRRADAEEKQNESLRRLELESRKKEAWEKEFNAGAAELREEQEHLRILVGSAVAKFESLPKCHLCASKGFTRVHYPDGIFRDESGKSVPYNRVCQACSCERGKMLEELGGEHYFVCPKGFVPP
jgi:hypothetical protein